MLSDSEYREKRKKQSGKEAIVAENQQLVGVQGDGVPDRVSKDAAGDNMQEVFQYDLPKAELGFTDYLKDHVRGERMPGVAVQQRSAQTREEVMRELENFSADINRKPVKMPRKFTLDLLNQQEYISLDRVFSNVDPKFPYVLVNKIKFVLTPLSSFFDSFTNVHATIIDTRMLNRSKRQSATLNSNVHYTGHVSLDYCVPVRSLSKLFIAVILEVPLMESGEQYAAMQFQVVSEQLDFPVVTDFKPIAAVAHLPPSGLDQYKYDPTHLDLTITNKHRKTLQQMYEDGDLAEPTKPLSEKRGSVSYSKSTVPPVIKPISKLRSEWAAVDSQAPPKQDADEISVDPTIDIIRSDSSDGMDGRNLDSEEMEQFFREKEMAKRFQKRPPTPPLKPKDSMESFDKLMNEAINAVSSVVPKQNGSLKKKKKVGFKTVDV